MEHAWQWGQERNGGRKSMERWVGLMWPRELPERKMGKRGGGTLMAVSGCQHLRKMGPEWYICQTARLCVSVHMCDRVSHSLHLLQPNTSHPALSTPLPSTFTHPSFHSSLSPPLFTLTVIWQAQGWQTWSWQGKRLSGPAWSGSCWLAEESTARAGRCDWPGDWCEGGRGVLPLRLRHGMGWTGIERAQRGFKPESKTQPELSPICATSLVSTLQFHRQVWDTIQTPAFTQILIPSVIKLLQLVSDISVCVQFWPYYLSQADWADAI